MSEVDPIRQQLVKYVTSVQSNVSGAQFNGLGLGGAAAYFTEVKDTIELVQAVRAACDVGLPYKVIGQGGSVLIADGGFTGLLIHNTTSSVAFSHDQSQVVLDSGCLLQRSIVQAAEHGFGGLIHLYSAGGSIGGALFHNVSRQGQPLSASLRSLTVLMPPTRIKPEPSIMRFKGSWLTAKSEIGESRLAQARKPGLSEAQPVILTTQLQLTSLRRDELQRRLQAEVCASEALEPSGMAHFGPVFEQLPGADVEELLRGCGALGLKQDGFFLDAAHPTFLRFKQKRNRPPASVAGAEAFLELVRAQVEAKYAVQLRNGFEVLAG